MLLLCCLPRLGCMHWLQPVVSDQWMSSSEDTPSVHGWSGGGIEQPLGHHTLRSADRDKTGKHTAIFHILLIYSSSSAEGVARAIPTYTQGWCKGFIDKEHSLLSYCTLQSKVLHERRVINEKLIMYPTLTIIIGTGETSFPSAKDWSGLFGICESHMYSTCYAYSGSNTLTVCAQACMRLVTSSPSAQGVQVRNSSRALQTMFRDINAIIRMHRPWMWNYTYYCLRWPVM